MHGIVSSLLDRHSTLQIQDYQLPLRRTVYSLTVQETTSSTPFQGDDILVSHEFVKDMHSHFPICTKGTCGDQLRRIVGEDALPIMEKRAVSTWKVIFFRFMICPISSTEIWWNDHGSCDIPSASV